jgi:hypothetical protein
MVWNWYAVLWVFMSIQSIEPALKWKTKERRCGGDSGLDVKAGGERSGWRTNGKPEGGGFYMFSCIYKCYMKAEQKHRLKDVDILVPAETMSRYSDY